MRHAEIHLGDPLPFVPCPIVAFGGKMNKLRQDVLAHDLLGDPAPVKMGQFFQVPKLPLNIHLEIHQAHIQKQQFSGSFGLPDNGAPGGKSLPFDEPLQQRHGGDDMKVLGIFIKKPKQFRQRKRVLDFIDKNQCGAGEDFFVELNLDDRDKLLYGHVLAEQPDMVGPFQVQMDDVFIIFPAKHQNALGFSHLARPTKDERLAVFFVLPLFQIR